MNLLALALYSNSFLALNAFWFSDKFRPFSRKPIAARPVVAENPVPASARPVAPPIVENQDLQDYKPFSFDIFSLVNKEALPISLRFREDLNPELKASGIVLFSGGDKKIRRERGFGRRSAMSIMSFAQSHGYNLRFLDELDYDRRLAFRNKKFHPAWSRVFALPSLRMAYTDAKYFVWFDDDVLVPHPETDMLNHYINAMELDPDWHMTIADEPPPNLLNSGMFIMKNSDLCYELFEKALIYGSSSRFFKDFGWEQEAIKVVRSNMNWEEFIRIVPHRQDKIYNINTFAVNQPKYPSDIQAQFGDAFVHFCGLSPAVREKMMAEWTEKVKIWKQEIEELNSAPIITNNK